ncbi:hypothetical protein Poli38472_013530 [Pythium oligandrum]|uniref:Uncharacterized protein n=1 Tax=Pythium oligandrum TaxID=41045 RepID=A0A8K1C7H1_PYTOL|nr:hypothetical protein Poli38472_013530 [Pythium oligandrum]|eukprot:TMW58056.1 hypothetical protein Poli38472_013530 [Pythium oligandrum]
MINEKNVKMSIDTDLVLDDEIGILASDTSQVDTSSEVLDAPTAALQHYDPFVKWLLTASMAELTSLHTKLPFEVGDNSENDSSTAVGTFANATQAKLARAEIEAECEGIADLLSVANRERGTFIEKVEDLQDERDESKERISLLESRIVKHLQDRDLAIAEKYTTEQQIVDIETWKAQHPQRQGSSFLGFMRLTERRQSSVSFNNKDIEKLQKEITDTKMDTAHAKTELDTHYYRLRQLEKKVALMKLEIAQASALEDDLQASLAHLRRDRKSSLDKLQHISVFSNASFQAASSPKKQTSPRKVPSPKKQSFSLR